MTRRHAVLHVGEQLELEDLGSTNGTRVRSSRLEAGDRAAVHPGEPFHVGSVLVMVQARVVTSPAPRSEDLDTEREDIRTWADRSGERAPAARASVQSMPAPPSSRRGRGSPLDLPVRIVEDPAMRALDALVDRVALGSINVLVLGESGAGKELIAARVHERSPRSQRPLLRLNCAALPESVLEAEWFGYERGAFTGAVSAKPGLLESADGGTVFLDEVSEMPLTVQAKILRVIETREVVRLGALKPRVLDLRFVAATNRPLEEEVRRGRFRQDLFFRLNGVAIDVPPLRQRPSEIQPLAESFVASAAQGLGRPPPRLRHDALRLLQHYGWPGNVRELKNFIERAVLLADGPELTPEHFPLAAMAATLPASRIATKAAEDDSERSRILRALEECGGNQSRAAKLLGIARSTLVLRLDEYKIPRPQKR